MVNFLLIGNDFTQLKSFFDKESLLLFQLSDLINRFLNYDLFEKFINLLDNLKKNSNLLLLFQKKFLHFYFILYLKLLTFFRSNFDEISACGIKFFIYFKILYYL